MKPNRSIHRRSWPAFSLIEMMVVIGVIVVLMGLFTGVMATLNSRNDIRQAESTIAIMEQAMKQWESTSERQITFGRPGEPPGAVYDVAATLYGPNSPNSPNLPPMQGVVLKIVMQDPAAAKILSQIPDKYLKVDSAKNPRIIDPWGQEIKIHFPGRVLTRAELGAPGVVPDLDNTVRLDDEMVLGPCIDRRICFISAGPDGKLKPPGNSPAVVQNAVEVRDNIYSYKLLPALGGSTTGGPIGPGI